MKRFAVIVPIGPSPVELRRFHDFIDSLRTYEEEARLCVAIDSSPRVRRVVPRHAHGCRFITLRAPFHGQGEALKGRLSASMLVGFEIIHREGPFDFVLRADTDALIAGPFRRYVSRHLARHPQIGMLGTLGLTCQRDSPYYGIERGWQSEVVQALAAAGHELPGHSRIEQYLETARQNGYAWKEYCQGGIYALPFRTLERMSHLRCFDHPEDWLPYAVPEDVMMGMFTRTVGLESGDFSEHGEPFASNYQGLAYRPDETLRRGHTLIHSVKSDRRYSERTLRRFFRLHRTIGRKYPSRAFSVAASL